MSILNPLASHNQLFVCDVRSEQSGTGRHTGASGGGWGR